MTERTLRGKAAIVGIGETPYYKHGQSPDPEFKLALMAVVAACEDAGVSPHDVDGFASYGNDRSDAGRLAAALLGPALLRSGFDACMGPETGHGNERLVAVLLEEHPLQRLSPLIGVGGHVRRALAEVPEDRARLRQRATVVEHEGGDAQRGVQRAEYLRAL